MGKGNVSADKKEQRKTARRKRTCRFGAKRRKQCEDNVVVSDTDETTTVEKTNPDITDVLPEVMANENEIGNETNNVGNEKTCHPGSVCDADDDPFVAKRSENDGQAMSAAAGSVVNANILEIDGTRYVLLPIANEGPTVVEDAMKDTSPCATNEVEENVAQVHHENQSCSDATVSTVTNADDSAAIIKELRTELAVQKKFRQDDAKMVQRTYRTVRKCQRNLEEMKRAFHEFIQWKEDYNDKQNCVLFGDVPVRLDVLHEVTERHKNAYTTLFPRLCELVLGRDFCMDVTIMSEKFDESVREDIIEYVLQVIPTTNAGALKNSYGKFRNTTWEKEERENVDYMDRLIESVNVNNPVKI